MKKVIVTSNKINRKPRLFSIFTSDSKTLLKHRQVKHFGFEFLYGTNNVDVNCPLDQKIPEECNVIWEKLKEYKINGIHEKHPDQLTVNKYEPGQGTIFYYLSQMHIWL